MMIKQCLTIISSIRTKVVASSSTSLSTFFKKSEFVNERFPRRQGWNKTKFKKSCINFEKKNEKV